MLILENKSGIERTTFNSPIPNGMSIPYWLSNYSHMSFHGILQESYDIYHPPLGKCCVLSYLYVVVKAVLVMMEM